MLILLLLSLTGENVSPRGNISRNITFLIFYLKCATKLLAGVVSRVKSFPYCTKLYL